MTHHKLRLGVLLTAAALVLSGCGFSPYKLPLPGGADLGGDPYTVKVEFRDVLDLVPQSAVRVNDLAVGKVTDIQLKGWNAVVTLKINRDAKLPDNAQATIRQTSLLGEKFVSLAPPTSGASGRLGDGDTIPLDRSGRNPEVEEVLGAASLLFNGGGLEKTNTIVRELNKTLEGNEPEIKQLIQTTTSFVSQLDDNKAAVLTSLEKVNHLAVETDKQKDAITGALDNLPEALKVVNGQRDDLVELLTSLDRLSDVATDVIRRSKEDTVADLKALVPTLRNLAAAGDDLATATRALLTYPFTDGFLGNSYAAATGTCTDAPSFQPDNLLSANKGADKQGACFGDFANLSLGLDINSSQITNLLGGLDLEALLGGKVPTGTTDTTTGGGDADNPTVDQLVELIPGLVTGDTDEPDDAQPTTQAPTPTPSPTATKPTTGGGICSLLNQCRPAAASFSDGFAAVLLAPVVTR